MTYEDMLRGASSAYGWAMYSQQGAVLGSRGLNGYGFVGMDADAGSVTLMANGLMWQLTGGTVQRWLTSDEVSVLMVLLLMVLLFLLFALRKLFIKFIKRD
jgi:hypothetical protein